MGGKEGEGGGGVCKNAAVCDNERRNSRGDCNHIWVVSAETGRQELRPSTEDRRHQRVDRKRPLPWETQPLTDATQQRLEAERARDASGARAAPPCSELVSIIHRFLQPYFHFLRNIHQLNVISEVERKNHNRVRLTRHTLALLLFPSLLVILIPKVKSPEWCFHSRGRALSHLHPPNTPRRGSPGALALLTVVTHPRSSLVRQEAAGGPVSPGVSLTHHTENTHVRPICNNLLIGLLTVCLWVDACAKHR